MNILLIEVFIRKNRHQNKGIHQNPKEFMVNQTNPKPKQNLEVLLKIEF